MLEDDFGPSASHSTPFSMPGGLDEMARESAQALWLRIEKDGCAPVLTDTLVPDICPQKWSYGPLQLSWSGSERGKGGYCKPINFL